MRAYNLMGGEINWTAMETVVEKFGINDVDLFIDCCEAIRDWQAEERERTHGGSS